MKRLPPILLLLCMTSGAAAQEFTFDASEFDKKAFEFDGYLEFKQEAMRVRSDSVGYQLAYPDSAPRDSLDRSTLTTEVHGLWRAAPLKLDFRLRAARAEDALVRSSDPGTLLDGGINWAASDTLSFDVGKRSQRWGKGYAWNPTAFVERAKDPNDTLLSREGYYMVGSEWIGSFDGPLTTLSLNPLLLPVQGDLNGDFGKPGHTNPALKAYALLYDTDIDLYWLAEGSRPERVGADFSRNLGSALEVHGEWARGMNVPRLTLRQDGSVSSHTEDQDSYLLGFRYISDNEITWIGELYHNGAGYSTDELSRFYSYAESISISGSPNNTARLQSLAQSGYGRSNPGQDYAYLRASLPEPFGWVYSSVALTGIMNLGDHSYQITPELSYTGFSNIEIRARLILLHGADKTEFGEKTMGSRVELYGRLHF